MKVLVVPNKDKETKEKKVGSITIPETLRHKKTLTEGKVIATGKGTPQIKMEVKEGDTVLFHNFDERIRIKDAILLEQNDILYINR